MHFFSSSVLIKKETSCIPFLVGGDNGMENWIIERHVYVSSNLPFLNLSAKCGTLNYKTNNSLVVEITVAVRSKAGNVFSRSNTGIVGSKHGYLCVRLFCVYVVLCRYRPCDWLIARPRSPTDCL
jgi:hypothetical protein